MYMYFNSSIRPVNRNKDTSTCISIRLVKCANTVLLLSYLLQCWKSGQPIKSTVCKFAPSHADLLSRVASSLCSRYFKFFKMAHTKTTPKNLVIKKRQLKRHGGKMVMKRCHGRLRAGPDSSG